MQAHSYTSEGIVIAKKSYGEADKILSIYSKDHGRIALIAKGVRRPKSRKRGHLETFNLIRFQAIKGRGLDIMTEAEIIDNYKPIRLNLKRISLGYYLMEVVGRITHENESNIELFDLIKNTLSKLEKTNLLKKLRMDFLEEILILLGYWPEGEELSDPDEKLEEVIERQINSVRVGKIISS